MSSHFRTGLRPEPRGTWNIDRAKLQAASAVQVTGTTERLRGYR